MRIIAGRWRGRRLKAPPGVSTRPTSDRVRETLFSMIVSRLGSFEGLRVADLFAGSGALGLEALSRGAGFACFVEHNPAAVRTIRDNLEALGATDCGQVVASSALTLPASEPFDLIFADPPYAPASGTSAAEAVARAGWLGKGGWMAVESARTDAVAPPIGWSVEVERDVGAARISLLYRP